MAARISCWHHRFSQVLLIVASRWRGFTAGSEGFPLPFRAGFWKLGIADKRVSVYLMLAWPP